MSWAARLASLSRQRYPDVDSVDSADSPSGPAKDTNGTIGTGDFCTRRTKIERTIDEAFKAEERAAIIADGDHGDPLATVPHVMPCSWAEASIEPTAGARCRNCGGKTWWCEALAPRGWRCASCHPGQHLPPDRRRDMQT